MRAVVTYWDNLTNPVGRQAETDWRDLFESFERVTPFLGDKQHPGWSPVRFDPCERALENVRQVYGLCLDYDNGCTIGDALTLWKSHWGMLHTTRKHTPDSHRFRVILPLVRPVSAYEFDALWLRVNAFAGGKLDPNPKDPSRFWFTPGIADGGEYITRRLVGDGLFDPDRWLARPAPASQQQATNKTSSNPPTDVEKRAIAYLAKLPEAISGSGGHAATWRAALYLAQGFGLSEEATLRILLENYNPRCAPQWSEKELAHKAKGAATKAKRVPNGFKLNTDREWSHATDEELPAEDYDGMPEEPSVPPVDPPKSQTVILSMADLMQLVVDQLNKPRPRMGASTGHNELDVAIGGFRQGNVTIFGAKRGFGKTSYGNMVTNLAVPRLRVLMFAGEDAAEMYGKRFLALRAGLNAMLLRDYRCNKDDWPRIAQAMAEAPKNPFFVRVEGKPVEWVTRVIADAQREGQVDLVIVDYLQKLRTNAKLQDRRNEVTYVTASLQDAVKKAGAAGLFFSQLKRTEREEPEIEDLKESGDIEDMADHVLLGWKEEASGRDSRARRLVKIAKNKDGTEASEIAAIELEWNQKTANFEAQQPPAPDPYFGAADNE